MPLDEVMGFVTLTITFLPSGILSVGSRKRQTTTATTVECTTSPCNVPYEAGSVRITGLNPTVDYNVEIQPVNGNNEEGVSTLSLVEGMK